MSSADIPILLVEPDPLVGEMLPAALRLHRKELRPVVVPDAATALQLAPTADFRLILCALELPAPEDGVALLAHLAELLPSTPRLVLTEGSRAALAALIDLEVAVVTRPPDMDHLLRRVDQLLDERGGSLVRGIRLEGLLQMLRGERTSCRILARARDGEGRLVLADGRLVHAETARAQGVEALFEILRWPEPLVRIVPGETAERTVEGDLEGLLLRFYVEADHRRREAEGGLG